MELVKEYHIREGRGTDYVDATYKLLLEITGDRFSREAGELVMNIDTCKRHGITPSLELVGRRIRCTLRTRVLPRTSGGIEEANCSFPDISVVNADDMMLSEIRRDEVWSLRYNVGSPHDEPHKKINHSLSAYSPSPTNHPPYKLKVNLTEDEFLACTKFEAGTVLTASFALMPPDDISGEQLEHVDEK
jgi:hypothetical protein